MYQNEASYCLCTDYTKQVVALGDVELCNFVVKGMPYKGARNHSLILLILIWLVRIIRVTTKKSSYIT